MARPVVPGTIRHHRHADGRREALRRRLLRRLVVRRPRTPRTDGSPRLEALLCRNPGPNQLLERARLPVEERGCGASDAVALPAEAVDAYVLAHLGNFADAAERWLRDL